MRRHKRKTKMTGYIKLHRAVEDHWIWDIPRRFQWWIQLLFMAAWEPKKVTFGNAPIHLQRGQIATTIRSLKCRFKCTSQAAFNFLEVLESNNMIVKETTPKMTLITIVNYEFYQQDSDTAARSNSPHKSTSAKRKVERKIGQIKEEKKEEEKNIINSSSLTRERDLEFFEELKNSEAFFEQLAMSLKIELASLKEYFLQFKDEMLLKEKFHDSSSDYRRHFISWVKIQISRGPRPNTNKYNGTGQKETADKRVARRGTDVGNHTADDFGGPF